MVLTLNELLRLYEEDIDAFGVEIAETFDYCRAKEALLSLPTIDIVHCGECRHWGGEDFYDCGLRDSYGWHYKPTDYCSYGELIDIDESY